MAGRAAPGDVDDRDRGAGWVAGGMEPDLYTPLIWFGRGTGVCRLGALARSASLLVFCFFADFSAVLFFLPEGISFRAGVTAVAIGPSSPSSLCLRFFFELASGAMLAAATLVAAFLVGGGAVIAGLGLETPKGVYRARKPSGWGRAGFAVVTVCVVVTLVGAPGIKVSLRVTCMNWLTGRSTVMNLSAAEFHDRLILKMGMLTQ